VLFILHEAFGARGGIAQFNRDFLNAAGSAPAVGEIVALPRHMPDPPGPLPSCLTWLTDGLGGKLRYALAVIRTALQRGPFDAVLCGHIRLIPFALLARAAMRRGRRVPIVLIVHGVDAWDPPTALARHTVRAVDRCLSVSAFTRDRMRAWTGLPDSVFEVLPNCVELARFSPGLPSPELMRRFGLENRVVILVVARLAAGEFKGLDQVIEVLPRLVKDMPRLTYVIAGEGPDRERLEAKARALGVADNVVFTGYVPESDKPDLYRLADGFVLAGRNEGFGIVLLEAMASGVPVLGSIHDATREVLGEGKIGLLVDPYDPEALARAIRELLRRPKGVVPPEVKRYGFAEFTARTHAALDRIAALASAR